MEGLGLVLCVVPVDIQMVLAGKTVSSVVYLSVRQNNFSFLANLMMSLSILMAIVVTVSMTEVIPCFTILRMVRDILVGLSYSYNKCD